MPSTEMTPPSRKDGPASEVCAANTSSHSNNANTTNSKYTKETPRQLEINKSSKKTSSPGEMVSETSPATNTVTEAEETVVASNKVSLSKKKKFFYFKLERLNNFTNTVGIDGEEGGLLYVVSISYLFCCVMD